MSHGAVAAKVRRDKEARPDHYCSDPRCLWRLSSGPCPKHRKGSASAEEGVVDPPQPARNEALTPKA